jgi:hypothetical protein
MKYKPTEHNINIINEYFSSPDVQELMATELGFSGKVRVDWEKQEIIAATRLKAKKWKLSDFAEWLE